MLLQPPAPSPPLAAAAVFVVDWNSAARAFPFYRAPWETRPTRELPRNPVVHRPALTGTPLRVVVQRQYWFGPVSDFLLAVGFLALGGGSAAHGSGWLPDPALEVDLGLAPRLYNPVFQTHAGLWEYPPLRARILEPADRGGPPK